LQRTQLHSSPAPRGLAKLRQRKWCHCAATRLSRSWTLWDNELYDSFRFVCLKWERESRGTPSDL